MRNKNTSTKRRELLVVNDAMWAKMLPHIIGNGQGRGAIGRDNRMFIEGVLWIARTGSAWRDLPEVFGLWNSVFRRFRKWEAKGIWPRIFEVAVQEPGFEYLIVADTIANSRWQSGAIRIRNIEIYSSQACATNASTETRSN